MEIGITSFVETKPDVHSGEVISHAQRLREVVEEIILADQVGLMCLALASTIEKIMLLPPQQWCYQLPLHKRKNSINKCRDSSFFCRSRTCLSGFFYFRRTIKWACGDYGWPWILYRIFPPIWLQFK